MFYYECSDIKIQSTEIYIEIVKDAYNVYFSKFCLCQALDWIIECGVFSWYEITNQLY